MTTPRVADEQERPTDGEFRVHRVRVPGVLAVERHRGDAGADVEVHRQLVLGARLPERVPGAVAEVGRAEILGIGRHVHPACAERADPLGFGDAGVDVPRRHQRHRQEPVAGVGLDLRHLVVVELDHQAAQVLVLHHAEVLAAETDGAREDDLRVDAALVENLEPHLRVVRADVDVVDRPLVEPDVGALLLAVAADDRGRGGLAEDVAVEHPGGDAFDLLHPRHAVLDLGRRDPGEEVVRFRPVRVGVDDQRSVVQHRGRG